MSTDLTSLWGAIPRGNTREIASHLIPMSTDPQSARNRISSAPARESVDTTAGCGAAMASVPSHDEIVRSQYRQEVYGYERLIEQLYDLARENRYDELHDLVRAKYLSIHGEPR